MGFQSRLFRFEMLLLRLQCLDAFFELCFKPGLFRTRILLLRLIFLLRFLQFQPQLCLRPPVFLQFALEPAAFIFDLGCLLLGRYAGLGFFGQLPC